MELNEYNSRFAVVKKAKDGGGVVSFCTSFEKAREVEKKAKLSGFSCGIVPTTEEAQEEIKDWYCARNFLYFDLKAYSSDMSPTQYCRDKSVKCIVAFSLVSYDFKDCLWGTNPYCWEKEYILEKDSEFFVLSEGGSYNGEYFHINYYGSKPPEKKENMPIHFKKGWKIAHKEYDWTKNESTLDVDLCENRLVIRGDSPNKILQNILRQNSNLGEK